MAPIMTRRAISPPIIQPHGVALRSMPRLRSKSDIRYSKVTFPRPGKQRVRVKAVPIQGRDCCAENGRRKPAQRSCLLEAVYRAVMPEEPGGTTLLRWVNRCAAKAHSCSLLKPGMGCEFLLCQE